MRDQYAGDISDYLKFAFLRAIASHDRRLGIAWYYLPGHDGRPDGRHVEYQREATWATLDGAVHRELASLEERSVAALERLPFWPAGTRFHGAAISARHRTEWVRGMTAAMQDADLVFLDPDNGLGKSATKHARIADLVALRRNGRAVSIIKFPGRRTHADQIRELHQGLKDSGFSRPLTIVTCVRVVSTGARLVPRHRFFTIGNADDELHSRAREFAKQFDGLTNAKAACVE